MAAGTITAQSTYALLDTQTELKPYLNIRPDDTDHDELLNMLCNWCSVQVEEYLDRKLITRGSITEYHTMTENTEKLYVLQWPLLTVTSIHEDAERSYGSTDLLTVTTDYILTLPKGKITRVFSSGSGLRQWLLGFRAIKVVYTGGYATTAAVPEDIKLATAKFCALVYRESVRREQGISSVSDDTGNLSRLFPAGLTPQIRKDLSRHKRWAGFGDTGEVDA